MAMVLRTLAKQKGFKAPKEKLVEALTQTVEYNIMTDGINAYSRRNILDNYSKKVLTDLETKMLIESRGDDMFKLTRRGKEHILEQDGERRDMFWDSEKNLNMLIRKKYPSTG